MPRRSKPKPRQPPPRGGIVAVTPAFRRFVLDQLAGVGDVAARSMFGGVGLYEGDVFFGIVAADVLYLKVDESTRADYERAGSQPFRPYPTRPVSLRYYAVPVDVLESADELTRWARAAVAAAKRKGPPRMRRASKN